MKINPIFFSIISALIIINTASPRTPLRPQPDFLPVSAWYSGGTARAPMLSTITPASREQWRADLAQIKSLGFNTVRTWVEWAHCEPKPGEYHFENLQLLCELAREEGLRVIIQMYVDSAPDWVAKQFPDGLFEAQSGDKVVPQAAPGCCTDHAGVRDAVLNFYTQTARVATRYANFHGWDLWSEPHIINWAYINWVPGATFCYCPHTMAAFQAWLQNKYITLEALNRAWYRNFTAWNEVTAPRFGTILSYTDFIDWKNFIYEKLALDLRARYDAIRIADKTHVITSHAAVPSIFYSPYVGLGATDDFLMAEQIDYYGTSLYPKHSHPNTHWETWKFQVAVDFSRSANRKNGGFYVGELQAGKGTYGLNIGNPITPEDHRIWMWSAIAKGAKAINVYAYYPMSSGYESGGYGLINLDGTVTERAIAAGRTARLLTENMDLFLHSRPVQAQAAIVYNPLAQMVGGEQRTVTTDMHQQSLLGYYRFFTENNIPVDFIHRRDLENDDLSAYRLIIVPYPLMFTQKAADGLKKFVAGGGCVVSEARMAWNDERGFATPVIPGMGLEQLFGAREHSVQMGVRPAMIVKPVSHPAIAELAPGDTLCGAHFAESMELITPETGQILASFADGTPCLIANRYGRGETIFIGTFLGMANHLRPNAENEKMLRGLTQWAGIQRPYTSNLDGVKETPVEIRMRTTATGYLLFVINHSSAKPAIAVHLKADNARNYKVTEVIQQKTMHRRAEKGLLTIEMDLTEKQVAVLHIE